MPTVKHVISCALCAVLSGVSYSPAYAQSSATLPHFDFRRRFLLAASDTDMLPSAYIDGKLGPRAGPDQLSVLSLDHPLEAMKPVTVPVSLDIGPFLVRFTPDGRFAMVNAMLLGTDIRGTVSSIRLAQSTEADGTPHHVLVSRVDAGVMPEGLAVSPDQQWIATTNLERTAQPLDDPK